MNKLIAILLIACIPSTSFASAANEEARKQAFYASVDCRKPYLIERGETTPCSGYVFSKELEEKIRVDLVHKDLLIKNLTEASDAQAEIIRMSSNQIDLYKLEIEKEKRSNLLDKVLYFGLGVVATYGASKAFSR